MKSICTRLDFIGLHASVVSHKNYPNVLSTHENDVAYTPTWKKITWKLLGVAESFMNPSLPLYGGMVEFCVLMEREGLLRYLLAYTRVVKTVEMVEKRFSKFSEAKESAGKRARASKETLLHENPNALNKLPLEVLYNVWIQTHKSSEKTLCSEGSVNGYILRKDAFKALFSTN